MKLKDLKIGDKIKFKTSKNSLQIYYGTVLGFKMDKVYVTKCKFKDYSGRCLETYIDETEILT
jgi:hypothetical protein